jgi:hypothetical protein
LAIGKFAEFLLDLLIEEELTSPLASYPLLTTHYQLKFGFTLSVFRIPVTHIRNAAISSDLDIVLREVLLLLFLTDINVFFIQ